MGRHSKENSLTERKTSLKMKRMSIDQEKIDEMNGERRIRSLKAEGVEEEEFDSTWDKY